MPLELPAGLGSLSLPSLPGIPTFPSLPSLPSIPSIGDILGGGSGASASSNAPASQKAGDRPISFLLDDASGSPLAFVDLVIRPEELAWTDSSRLAVNQTLHGVWIDNFGRNVPAITLSGHTGWRQMGASSDDGLARFATLKTNVFDKWHDQRQQNIDDGLDPNAIRLIFSDALDDRSVVVAPRDFVLRRSRSRPLLAQFQISLVVLDDALQNAPFPAQFGFNGATGSTPGPLGSLTQSLGLSSLTGSINSITSQINGVRSLVQGNLVAPVQAFMTQSAQVFGAVRGAISSGVGLAKDVISIAQDVAQTGINVFRTLSAVGSIPQLTKQSLSAIAGSYTNIFCVMSNALGQKLYIQDYSDLYGASNCSSTSGGRPASTLAGVNPFYEVVPSSGSLPINVSSTASAALRSIASSDPVLSPLSPDSLNTALRQVTSGISFPTASASSLSGAIGSFFS
jgi:hypothetical protein